MKTNENENYSYSEKLIFRDLTCEKCGTLIGKAGHHGTPDPSNDETYCLNCWRQYEEES